MAPRPGAPRRRGGAAGESLLRMGSVRRLLFALAASLLVWAIVFWAKG